MNGIKLLSALDTLKISLLLAEKLLYMTSSEELLVTTNP